MMPPTAREWFEGLVHGLAPRLRIAADPEGWPMVPCRYGQIEWAGGVSSVAIYCDAVRLFRPLFAIPGVRRHQTGDIEVRALLPVDDAHFRAAFSAAAALLRARTRQLMTEGRKLALDHGRVLFQPKGA